MTKVPTALGRAAKAERLVMVGPLRVAVREMNFLSGKQEAKKIIYDNRV